MKHVIAHKLVIIFLLFGVHAEVQLLHVNIYNNPIQISSIELTITFVVLFLIGYVAVNKIKFEEVFREKLLFWILFLFCLSLILSTIFAQYKIEAVKYDIRIIATVVLFYLLLQYLFREKLKEFSLIILNIVGLIVSIIGMLEYFEVPLITKALHLWGEWGEGSRPHSATSAFIHNNVFGNYLILLFFIVMGQYKETANKFYRILLGWTAGIYIITAVFTLSRGAWVACIFAVGIYIFLKRKDKSLLKHVGCALFLLIFTVAANPYSRARVVRTVNSLVAADFDRITRRSYRWRVAYEMFKKDPLFGVGINNFRIRQREFSEILPQKLRVGFLNDKIHANNLYISVLAELGLFGFVCFMAFVAYLIFLVSYNIKHGGNEFFALAIVAYLVGEFFDYLWLDYSFLFLFWFVLILNILEKRRLDEVPLRESPQLIAEL